MAREDFGNVKRQQFNNRSATAKRGMDRPANQNGDVIPPSDQQEKDGKDESGLNIASAPSATAVNASMPPPAPTQSMGPRQPWEHVEEVMNILKTAFPLLALTMEKMVDQISLRAKPASEEDIYRFFAALLADAHQVS